ncbi:hypothetical protein MVLG_04036 [Microbotryum lychnidis-dioicae p1A1 Lamole]|uniref:SAC domain-containing protein n=1 Tax=Microbotryum lychnidis-dioicae (strain p1A1 Lamole / MvSl-1064) TaxID=683840 RepID=U5H9Z9_USTV1|nr:hypothetical protein MVLG_04036 [Microbotryum lychnidis-dioicae p1A1 Lamole]|eukprot:KDE05665.1 hypothetical protein MVLG_04036 [Microbotryum lychnidis-dioicae p1A1 Lamole]
MASLLHEQLKLYVANDAYTLVGESEKPQTLVINRATNVISITPSSSIPSKFEKEHTVYGLFGIITLLRSDYLVVVTKRKKVATVLGAPVYTATDFAVFPIERRSTVELLGQPDEAYLLGLLKSHLFSAPFHFTYGGWNVTTRLQQQQDNGTNSSAKAFWETSDDRFFWNRHLQRRVIDASANGNDCSRFVLPVMLGFLEFKNATINGREFLFGLVSRRNRFRAGTRYFSRGIDREGNVSNFNETEQIVLLDSQTGSSGGVVRGDIIFSYVQTRGSVPVYWAEINNLRYKPDLKIMEMSNTAESLKRHFDTQIDLYGDQYLVNLVNQKGYEKPVKEAYERAIETMGNNRVHYTYFDFHHECKGLRFDRVSVLIDSLDEQLHKQAYFHHDKTSSPSRPQSTQTSVVRTNCMDCLDRTNVVQSALAKWVLNNQLRSIGVLSPKESIEEHKPFLKLFRNVWADNANAISRAYSGTGALKTDYTRTGKRSKEGALQDGVNSLVRYIKNNFLDGPRQDAYDLVSGSWMPRTGDVQTWRDQRSLVVRSAPLVALLAIGALFLALAAPTLVGEYLLSARQFTLLSLAVLLLAMNFVLNHGVEYVSYPKLVSLDDIVNYNGKGFESGRHGRPLKKAQVVSAESAAKRGAASSLRKEGVPVTNGAKKD